MAWIRVDDSIREHDKIFNLADVLKIEDAHAVGLMTCLWTWAASQAPDGNITNFPPRAIAKAAGWHKKDFDEFYRALKEVNFLEVRSDNQIFLRNWEQRQEMFIDYVGEVKEKNALRQKRYRERKKAKKEHRSNVTGNATSNVTHNVTNVTSNTPTVHRQYIDSTVQDKEIAISKQEDISSLPAEDNRNVENSVENQSVVVENFNAGQREDETRDEISLPLTEFTRYIRPATKADKSKIERLCDQYGADQVVQAIYIGEERGAKSTAYIQRILETLEADNE